MRVKEPSSARRRVMLAVFDLDGQPKTGLTYSGAQIQVSKNGAAFANGLGAVTEVGLGVYYYTADVTELDTIGKLVVVLAAQAAVSQQAEAIEDVALPVGLHNIPNSMLDNFVYDGSGMMTSCRLRVFVDDTALAAAVAGHADGTDSEIERHTITGVDGGGGKPSSVKYAQGLP